MSLQDEINKFVGKIFDGFATKKVRAQKAIHERVWGTNIYSKHEIAMLDTPLMQRLRQIHQTGLVFFTYPSSLHTRFDHTLGCISLVSHFVHRIKERVPQTDIFIEDNPEKGDLAELRMAALLHDCGHAFFSHVSEEIYRWYPDMMELLSSDEFTHCKPHEILSYLIVKSPIFMDFFKKSIEAVYPIEINLQKVANYIIGKAESSSKLFLAHIINGPFDIDKIDYIFRDSNFAGLSLTMDLDRFLYTLSCYRFDNGICDLIIEAPVPSEQIIFSKMLLYSLIYHHQKVKSCDCLLHGLTEYIYKNSIPINGIFLTNPADFLYLTDNDIISCSHNDSFIQKTLKNLRERRLFKRAVVICKDTISNYDENIYFLLRLNEDPNELFKLREAIRDELPNDLKRRYNVYEIHICLPQLPSLREASQTFVGGSYSTGVKRTPITIDQIFPLSGWLSAYANKQWRGYIFCPDDDQLLKAVYKIAKKIFKEKYNLDLNKKSLEYCHRDEDESII